MLHNLENKLLASSLFEASERLNNSFHEINYNNFICKIYIEKMFFFL